MEPFGSARQLSEISLQHLAIAVEERPGISLVELLVARFPPFLEQVRQFPIGQNTDIHRADHDVVDLFVGEVVFFVSLDALVLVLPSSHELADGTLDQGDKIPADEPCMFAGHANLPRKGKIIADKDTSADNEAGGECLVVAVSDPEHIGVVIKYIKLPYLTEAVVQLPSLSAQQDFVRRVTAVENLKANQRTALTELDALFASLQHRAFRGELDGPQKG